MLRTIVVALAAAIAAPSMARGQMIEVTPRTDSVTVGDSVLLAVRLHLRDQDALLDSVPRLTDSVDGLRVLAVEPMRRQPDRAFDGRVWVAFYRTGTHTIPPFELRYRRGAIARARLVSNPVTVTIVPTLPPGSPSLRDIRDIEPTAGPNPLPIVFAVLGAGILIWLFRRSRRRSEAAPEIVEPAAEPVPEQSPYEQAVTRLDEIKHGNWPTLGRADRHYEEIVATLREYLERAEAVPAGERTTAELLWSLPPHLTADGLRERCHTLFREADLVKFARLEPDGTRAGEFLTRARALLDRWHDARPALESIDAVR